MVVVASLWMSIFYSLSLIDLFLQGLLFLNHFLELLFHRLYAIMLESQLSLDGCIASFACYFGSVAFFGEMDGKLLCVFEDNISLWTILLFTHEFHARQVMLVFLIIEEILSAIIACPLLPVQV